MCRCGRTWRPTRRARWRSRGRCASSSPTWRPVTWRRCRPRCRPEYPPAPSPPFPKLVRPFLLQLSAILCKRSMLNFAGCRCAWFYNGCPLSATASGKSRIGFALQRYPQHRDSTEEYSVPFSAVVYIERDDFREEDSKDFYGLAPGKSVMLRYDVYSFFCFLSMWRRTTLPRRGLQGFLWPCARQVRHATAPGKSAMLRRALLGVLDLVS